MRWEALIADLEAQAVALEQAGRAAEIDERTRGEVGSLGLGDRLRASVGMPLRIRLAAAGALAGRLQKVGPDWLLLDEGAGREVVVVTDAIAGVRGLGRFSATPGRVGVVESRLGLRQVLRGMTRDRSAVRLRLRDGDTIDATLDRVGADFVEVATHAVGEARRRADVRDVELVALRALAAVQRQV